MSEVLVEARGLSRHFGKTLDLVGRAAVALGLSRPPGIVRAVDQVDLTVRRGDVRGLVGESGCGKSTLGRMIAGIVPPTSGQVFWKGRDRAGFPAPEQRALRLKAQMIFQNPFASLNPRRSVADIVGEAPRVHGLIDGDAEAYVDAQLSRAGLDPSLKRRFPHQFSGGQRQRIGIARALAVDPEFLICDEAVAALDVSIQAQIINLFMDLRAKLGLTYLFISHDLGVVEFIADRVVVMYLGRVVESAAAGTIFEQANHPYTQALLAEVGKVEPRKRTFVAVKGEIPSPLAPPPGCHFHPRCPHAMPRCREQAPPLVEIAPSHWSACWLNEAGARG
jgi:peptide/nickel transport system ATP-binding protein